MSNGFDIFALLERNDKWFLGGGKTAMFAPAFPKWLDTPGFWDEAYCADIRLERLFCLLFADEQGRPLNLRRATRRWTPDCLTQIYTIEGLPGVRVQEERVVTDHDVFASRITLNNTTPNPVRLNILLWSLPEQKTLVPNANGFTVADVVHEADGIHFAHRVQYASHTDTPAEVHGWGEREREEKSENALHEIYVALGASRMPDSWTINLAEATDTSPLWNLSVAPEKFRRGTLAQEQTDSAGWNPDGLVHLMLHYGFETPSNSAESITFGAAVGFKRDKVLAALRGDMSGNVVEQSRRSWHEFWEQVPYFECDDPHLERAYWYRWYGLRLMRVDAQTGQLPKPCVFEGLGGFRSHISYSAQCHARELSWLSDRSWAMGSIENFLVNQVIGGDNDGFLPGHLYTWRRDRGFYHANWGRAAEQIYHLTGDEGFVRRIYAGLARYADYFYRERDREESGLYDVIDQGETGQEYMSRYLFVDPSADTWRKIQVKGVDASCYVYELCDALARFAGLAGNIKDAFRWGRMATKTKEAIRAQMWDADAVLFKDTHPQTREQSPYKAAVGFYPFLSDIADESHLGAWHHLDNAGTFGTPFPIPASSVDDSYFDAEAGWKGKRTNCPWNGRVWPMTTSHVIDALAHSARRLEPSLRPRVGDMLLKFVRMMFWDGDPKRPNCFEHYNPFTGTPSAYRGVDDYQHSTLIDLIFRHVVGIQPQPAPNGRLIIDPLPCGLKRWRAENVMIRGKRVDVWYSLSEGFGVRVDGQTVHHGRDPEYVEVDL